AGADDNTDVTDGEAWTEHTTDALPWSDIDVDTAEAVKLGFVEYQDSGTAGHPYYDLLCLCSSLDLPSYEFTFLWYGDALGPALQYQGEIDRYEKDPTKRRVDVKNVAWDGEQVYLGRDQAYGTATGGAFKGWIRVDLPRIAVTLLSAGEAAPAYMWSGDLVVIWGWDPTTSSYTKLFEQSYGTITAQQTVSFGPVSHSLRVSGHPQLDYQVEATLTVNPPVVTEEFSGGDRSKVSIQAPSIVSGTMSYVVDDAKALQRLYDLDLAFDLGSMGASARYVEVSGS
ncbi:MAG: hypothetical protein M3N51_00890, partial [Actinomycetota bacterium]|nr:hypothetical protein [Actinomycetota bacterium]